MSSKLALGTVQFGLSYGVANRTGQVTPEAVGSILNTARTSGLDTLDTAIGYGNSEAVLGNAGVEGWQVVTKLGGFPGGDARSWVGGEVKHSLERLGLVSVHALMLHRPADLLGPSGKDLFAALRAAKDAGGAAKVGYSIYSPQELDVLFDKFQPDIVQVPFNALDRRLVASGWLERLVERQIEVHSRSAFLQGLLLLPPDKRPERFGRWEAILGRWDRWCEELGGDRVRAALAHVMAEPRVTRVVVGVDTPQQLEQIVRVAAQPPLRAPEDLATTDESLLNPSLWSRQ